MKTRIVPILIILTITACGCSAPSYVPEAEYLDVNAYGSHITITTEEGPNIRGELITVDEYSLLVLTESSIQGQAVQSVAHSNMLGYRVQFAQPEEHGWTIFVYSLWSFSHGLYALLTLPVNLITTIAVTAGGSVAYSYTEDEISWRELRMFARFPQGVPASLDVHDLRSAAVEKKHPSSIFR